MEAKEIYSAHGSDFQLWQRGNVAVVCWGLRTSRGGPWEPFVSPGLIRNADQKDESSVNEKVAALCVLIRLCSRAIRIYAYI